MKILEYADLDVSRVSRQYQKLIGFLENDDFQSAEVKKLAEHDIYRAKLDDSNRLLFKMVAYEGKRYALVLEVVLNHAYEKSKFLRNARIDESKIQTAEISHLDKEKLPSLIYVNPSERRFHFLDKVISFDPEQKEIYLHSSPLIIIGPAGSGKTALILEKMKKVYGQVLYVTLSPYLAENARNLYYANHYENGDQEASFLSLREFIETMRVPEGREISYHIFAGWLLRFPRQQRVADAHRLYEEFRGVITGSIIDTPWLSREAYLSLGVRQSIYLDSERELVYTLFEKYITFLKEHNYYDPNILAHSYLNRVFQSYDFVVVDEVQDITMVQLQLILRSLKKPDQFVFSGDSNQIVHPNFFSWSSLKSMLYHSETLEPHKGLRILRSNFRNSSTVTETANMILRIKQKRFGSIDRESNYLMKSQSDKAGEIVFLKDTDRTKTELNQQIRRSTKFAVLVMRDEDKAEVRRFFDTPLLFSIHEAKGLEYENVVLVNFITNERASFLDIISGISAEDLQGDVEYMRAGDKRDKSHEVYKFFINSLYVAVTRAVERLYIIEGDTRHSLIGMLGIRGAKDDVTVDARQSSMEEWQAEARRLELQGRQEQADEIRRDILKTQPVPWDVCYPERVLELVSRVCDKKEISQKPKKALFDYALFYDEPGLIELLGEHGFDRAKTLYDRKYRNIFFDWTLYERQRADVLTRYLRDYSSKFFKDIITQCERYGVDYRTVFNKTPLMLAAAAGNTALVHELMTAGADPELNDNHGLTAWQGALQRAAQDSKFASDSFPGVNEILAPASVSLKVDDRLIKIDANQGEFFLLHIFFATLHSRIGRQWGSLVPLTAVLLEKIISSLPGSIIADYRKKRSYTSSLLSKNEIDSTNPYCKKLFKRKRTGNYILNPKLAVRRKDEWVDVYDHADIGLLSGMDSESGRNLRSIIKSLISDDKVF